MKRINQILAFTFALCATSLSAQLTVQDSIPIDELVNDIFNTGTFVEVSNITFNGEPAEGLVNAQVGLFANGFDIDLPIDSGFAMTTGDMSALFTGGLGTFMSTGLSDPDILTILDGFSANDCAVLEFDVLNQAEALAFNFSFASIEYANYTCSSFNDAFGLFISGPGLDGPFTDGAINIATIPDSDIPIAINTINGGVPTGGGSPENCESVNPNWQEDSIYFIENYDNGMGDIGFTGLTVNIEAFVEVEQNEIYHIKFAICDASDTALDSGIMLEANSFEGRFTSSTDDRDFRNLKIFPNPADDRVFVDIPEEFSGESIGLRVTDIQGRTVSMENVNGGNRFDLKVSQLPAGAYIISLFAADQVMARAKFLKK